jgi:RNA polymerase sigma-70 factor (ECF subfamily)
VLAGRTEAYSELVLKYQDRLYHVALRIVGHPDDAADVVQETFISAYQSLGTFKGDSEFYTWLYRIAFNAAVSWKRRKRNIVSLEFGTNDSDINLEPADTSRDHRPGEAIERDEDVRKLQEGMLRLSPEHRAVLTLKEMEGLKYEEIAEVLGVPVGTVRSRLSRARLELRSLLDPDFQPDDSTL